MLLYVFHNGSIDHTDRTMTEIMRNTRDFRPVAGPLAASFTVSPADYNALSSD